MIISYLINVFLIVQTFPKIKKFNNNKATFPLFDALGEPYDVKFPNNKATYCSLISAKLCTC